MKKLWKRIVLALASLFIAVGLVFCLIRPAYVREAVQLLFKNELNIESDSGSGVQEEQDSVPEEKSEASSDIAEE